MRPQLRSHLIRYVRARSSPERDVVVFPPRGATAAEDREIALLSAEVGRFLAGWKYARDVEGSRYRFGK